MLNLVLFQPEIPSNTGSLIRLSANMGANLHLIKPYGFEMNDKRLRRAGLDYKELASVYEYENFDDYLDKANPAKLYFVSTKVVAKPKLIALVMLLVTARSGHKPNKATNAWLLVQSPFLIIFK